MKRKRGLRWQAHLAVFTADAVSALGSSFQGAVVGVAAGAGAFLQGTRGATEQPGMSPDKLCTGRAYRTLLGGR